MPKKFPRFVKHIAVNSVTGHANAIILRRFIKKRQNRIFFYPAARFDFEVLREFDGLCSTFIYCDHLARFQEFQSGLRVVGLGWKVGKVQVVDLKILRLVPEQLPENVQRFVPVSFRDLYKTVTDDWRRNDAWGRCVILRRRHGSNIAGVRGLLRTIAHQRSIDFLRKRWTECEVPIPERTPDDDVGGFIANATLALHQGGLSFDAIIKELAHAADLDAIEEALVQDHIVGRCTQADFAETYRIPLGSIGNLKREILIKLKALFDGEL